MGHARHLRRATPHDSTVDAKRRRSPWPHAPPIIARVALKPAPSARVRCVYICRVCCCWDECVSAWLTATRGGAIVTAAFVSYKRIEWKLERLASFPTLGTFHALDLSLGRSFNDRSSNQIRNHRADVSR